MAKTASQSHSGLERARTVSKLLDSAIELPVVGVQVGLDPLLGILPVAGDTVAAALSLYIVAEAALAGASARVLATMLSLIAVDLLVGSIPVVGTLFDALWKTNVWNVRLLERHLES